MKTIAGFAGGIFAICLICVLCCIATLYQVICSDSYISDLTKNKSAQ